MYQEKMREATASCLLAVALSRSSLDQMQMQPPSRFPIAWATARRMAAANPNLKAWQLGSRHSNIHTFKCFTCSIHNGTGNYHSSSRSTQPFAMEKERYHQQQTTQRLIRWGHRRMFHLSSSSSRKQKKLNDEKLDYFLRFAVALHYLVLCYFGLDPKYTSNNIHGHYQQADQEPDVFHHVLRFCSKLWKRISIYGHPQKRKEDVLEETANTIKSLKTRETSQPTSYISVLRSRGGSETKQNIAKAKKKGS